MNDEERAYNLEEFAASAPTPLNPGVTMAAKGRSCCSGLRSPHAGWDSGSVA